MTTASGEEIQRRQRRKEAYHLSAGHNKLPPDADDTDFLFRYLTEGPSQSASEQILRLKTDIVRELAISGGDGDTPRFSQALDHLTRAYDPSRLDVRDRQNPHLGGMWLTLTKPKYKDCIGRNEDNEYKYTLGRMSFEMFRPSDLVCSIQGTFNPVHYVSRRDREALELVPESLKTEIKSGNSVLRTYDVVTACTIEPDSVASPGAPNRIVKHPIKTLMTAYGYAIPDPTKPNRLSVWFTGGSIEVIDMMQDQAVWRKLFGSLPQQEKKRLFSARLAMGATPPTRMEQDGKMSYTLQQPRGGHGVAFVDVLYLDETLRVVRGSAGDVVVFARVPHFPDE